MKKLLLLLMLSAAALAQTTVTGTVVDPNGNPYANGTVSAQSVVASGQPQVFTSPAALNASGAFSITLNAASYLFTVCAAPVQIGPTANPTPKQVCFSSNPIAISGGSQDISTQLNALATALGPQGSQTGGSQTLNTLQVGSITKYGGVLTVAGGVPALVAKVDLTAQQANVGSTLLYAVPASGAGFYRVSFYLVVTQAATVSSTLPNGQISFTDNDTGIAGLGPYLITGTNTGNQVGASNSVPALPAAESAILNCKASTNINYSTNNYASSGATPMQYAIHVKLEYLGN